MMVANDGFTCAEVRPNVAPVPPHGSQLSVVLLAYRRPALTARVLDRIRAAQPAELFVVADGHRPDRPEEAKLCAEVRAVIEHGVNWPCKVRLNYAERNLGCALRVSSGLNWVFEQTRLP